MAVANEALYINLRVNRFGQLYLLGKQQQVSLPKSHRPLECGLEKIILLKMCVCVCVCSHMCAECQIILHYYEATETQTQCLNN